MDPQGAGGPSPRLLPSCPASPPPPPSSTGWGLPRAGGLLVPHYGQVGPVGAAHLAQRRLLEPQAPPVRGHGQCWGRSLAQGTENAASLPFIQRAADGGQIDAVIHVGDTVQHTLAQVGDMAYDMAEHEGRRGDLFMQQVCRLWTTGGQVEPVASLVPYMTCPGNHEWHYNFTNYRYLGTWGTWGD